MKYDTSNPLQKEQFKLRSAKLAESGKVVELTEKKPLRTTNQNSYLHVILGYFAAQTGNTLEWVKKKYYKELVNPDTFKVEKDDPFIGKTDDLRSSSDLDTAEMTLTIERFRNWSAAQAGIYLPSPDEERLLQLAEIEMERYKEYI